MLYHNYQYTVCSLLPVADAFGEFGTSLMGARLRLADVKVKGVESSAGGGLADTETRKEGADPQ